MKSRFYIIVLCFSFCISLYGNHKIDSLLQVVATSKVDSVQSKTYFQLSNLFFLNNPRQSLKYVNKSIYYFQSYSNNFPYAQLHIKTSIFRLLGNLDSSIYYNNKIYVQALKLKNLNALSEVYGEYGLISVAQNNFQKAIEYFTKQIITIKKNKLGGNLSGIYNNMGIAYGNKGDWAMAKEYFSKALKDDLQNKRIGNLGNDYNNLGVVHIISHALDSAANYFNQSLIIRRATNDSLGIGGSYNNLALLENEKLRFDFALRYTDSSLAIALPSGYKKMQAEVYDSYDQIYSKMGNYKMAYEYLNKKNKLNAVFEKEKFNNDIHQLEVNIQEEQNQTQLLQKNLQLTKSEKQKQKQLAILIVAIVLIVALIIFLYNFFRNNKVLTNQNSIISHQKKEIEEKHKNITDSITYAHRIQSSLIPNQHQLNNLYPGISILFKPKDIVSGDFYWFNKVKDYNIFVLADCTGHGVPGAFMSIIGINCLNTLVLEKSITTPHLILNELKKGVVNSLNSDNNNADKKDGMDVALVTFTNEELVFSGANQSVIVLRKNEISVLKGNKQPVGFFDTDETFTSVTFKLLTGDRIILFSDGVVDQFGGTEGKKLKIVTFRKWVLETSDLTAKLQLKEIETRLTNYMMAYEQTDDITLAIIEINT